MNILVVGGIGRWIKVELLAGSAGQGLMVMNHYPLHGLEQSCNDYDCSQHCLGSWSGGRCDNRVRSCSAENLLWSVRTGADDYMPCLHLCSTRES